jgi:hypothetical protein
MAVGFVGIYFHGVCLYPRKELRGMMELEEFRKSLNRINKKKFDSFCEGYRLALRHAQHGYYSKEESSDYLRNVIRGMMPEHLNESLWNGDK